MHRLPLMSPMVSVVVPSYNDAAMLRRCLAALAAQTRPADEIVVVDNGSSDSTVDVAIAYGARVVTELRRGIPQATSAGFDAARGDILGRLDADSVPPVDWVERLVDAFEREPELEVLSGPGLFYGGHPFVHWFAERVQMSLYETLIGFVLGHDVLYGSNLALRASTWRDLRHRVHRDDNTVHDDLDFAINLEPGTGVRYDPSFTVGVSARPFADWARYSRTVRMAFGTLALNHREESLWERKRAWQIALAGNPDEDGEAIRATR